MNTRCMTRRVLPLLILDVMAVGLFIAGIIFLEPLLSINNLVEEINAGNVREMTQYTDPDNPERIYLTARIGDDEPIQIESGDTITGDPIDYLREQGATGIILAEIPLNQSSDSPPQQDRNTSDIATTAFIVGILGMIFSTFGFVFFFILCSRNRVEVTEPAS